MDTAQALAFALFAFVAAVTPGPSNAMILSTGAAVGAWRGITCPIGASLGMGVMIVLSAFGVGEIVAAAPKVVIAMKMAGSLFLVWLAWQIVNAGTFEADGQGRATGFLQAFLFQWLNPKGWLVALSAGSTYLVPVQYNQISGALWMGTLFAAAAFPAGMLWLAMGALMASLLRGERSARRFNIVMALALAASVVLVWR
ncbi:MULTISPECIES: LysE family translocator [Rhizobium]|uniref:Cysteine/O-acetylserine efflux protein n=1 Tax=Rhizobium favelukesii TaxID=348824 RepID=W6R9Q1_9HYPH|nr:MULTISPECIES: LysE family translocator [Rhizobium]MCA0802046.1 LysE family translocator [Rhizobium sp. T1473]MCS0458099.1 LysE family translocator [Rhizobium favelukesii]UFS84376.1 LysE family translocator [Rhizobium sp. T136]CDM57952.1 Cysteine/O-acetylserine efflux protein [Rhizobium favelukesii]